MRELHYENQGTNTYLVYEIKADDSVDSMSLGMLTNNKIHGLAQTLFMQMDDKKFVKYNISAKVTAEDFFTGVINRKRVLGVFGGIVDAMLSAEDYMINSDTILLDLKYIFTDVSTCETSLICLPVMGANTGATDLGSFFKNIMFTHQFDQTENCDYIVQIINYLNSTPLFSLCDFKKLLDTLKLNGGQTGAAAQPATRPMPQPATQNVSRPAPQPVAQPMSKPAPQSVAQPVVQQIPVASKSAPNPVAVPPQQPKGTVSAPPASDDDKKMSFFYLMQHYNKDNKAAYKAQKEARKKAKKNSATVENAQSPVQQPVPQKVANQTAAPSANFSFAIPGQAAPAATAPAAQFAQQPKVPQPQQPQPQRQPVVSAPVQQPMHMPQQTAPQMGNMNFGETTVLGGGVLGETTVLSAYQGASQMIAPHLIRGKNNEKISLNKPVFRVGKERSYVDYFIGDNTAISRSHANFITRDGEYFVVDTNSTNHTFVNGNIIQSNTEVKLSHGDKVTLANEDFEFKIY